MKSPQYHYNLESKSNKDGTRLIFLNLSYGYKEVNPLSGKSKYKYLRISTQKRVHPDNWDDKNGTLKKSFANNTGKTIKNKLDKYLSVSLSELEKYRDQNDKNPTPKELLEIVKRKIGRTTNEVIEVTVVDAIESIITKNQDLTPTAKGRVGKKQIGKYGTVRNNLSEFQEYLGRDVLLSEFDNVMFYQYLDFLNERYKSDKNPYGYMVNTMSKKANTLTAILRKIAKNKDLTLTIDLTDESLRIDEVPAADSEVYISEADLQKVIDADTFSVQGFENARNFIIICASTSLRYADMAHLHEVEVEEVTSYGRSFLGFDTLIRKPTNQSGKDYRTFIPVLKPLKEILVANDGKFPRFPANSSMNIQLKRFAKHLELNALFEVERNYFKIEDSIKTKEPLSELITCHIGRDSFVTNLSGLGVNHPVIMSISHPEQSKNTMQKYYDKTSSVARAALLLEELNRVKSKTDIYQG